MLSLQDIDAIILSGGIVIDPVGDKIGSVEQVFTTGDSGTPAFVTVRTGLFGMSESFVPLEGASLDGTVITAAFTKDLVKNGPRIDSDRGTVTDAQEQELYRYFGIEGFPENIPEAATADTAGGTPATDGNPLNESRAGANAPDRSTPAQAASAGPGGRGHAGHAPAGPPLPPPPPHLHRHVPEPPHPREPHPRGPGPRQPRGGTGPGGRGPGPHPPGPPPQLPPKPSGT